ncbi:MAG: hypothetical protein ACXABF_11140 [Candidatus Thorarchaeota archaeon]|jgi:hypothetical protein
MQIEDTLNFIQDLIDQIMHPPLLYIVPILLVLIIVGIAIRRSKRSSKAPIMKQIGKMLSTVEKGKIPDEPTVSSRQEIVTNLFESKMQAVGVEPSKDSGYIPTSQTPLAQYLRKYEIPDDIIDAILAGLQEESTEEDVRAIIDAAADTPDVNLDGIFLDKAKDLAVEEWKRARGRSDL